MARRTSAEAVFSDADEMEHAASLLEAASEAELDRFLGDLIDQAGRAIGSVARSPAKDALARILKAAAKRTLPIVVRAVDQRLGSTSDIGTQVVQAASKYFGLSWRIEPRRPGIRSGQALRPLRGRGGEERSRRADGYAARGCGSTRRTPLRTRAVEQHPRPQTSRSRRATHHGFRRPLGASRAKHHCRRLLIQQPPRVHYQEGESHA